MKPCWKSIALKARYCLFLCTAAAVPFVETPAIAQEGAAAPGLTIRPASPSEKSDGTLSPAANAAIEHGPLPASAADIAAKAAANRAAAEAEKQGAKRPVPGDESAVDGEKSALPLAPSIAAPSISRVSPMTRSAPPTRPARSDPRDSCSSLTGALASSIAPPERWLVRAP